MVIVMGLHGTLLLRPQTARSIPRAWLKTSRRVASLELYLKSYCLQFYGLGYRVLQIELTKQRVVTTLGGSYHYSPPSR